MNDEIVVALAKEVFGATAIEVSQVDGYRGWWIGPRPGVVIELMWRKHPSIENDDGMHLLIRKFILEYTPFAIQLPGDRLSVKEATIFCGPIPPNEDFEPDFDFVKSLLKNYKAIG